MSSDGREKFLALARSAVEGGTLVKLTLGKPKSADKTLRNVFIRPVELKAGPRFSFVWRHATKDITKNHEGGETLRLLGELIGTEFLDAHLFTTTESVQLELGPGKARLKATPSKRMAPEDAGNDRKKQRPIPTTAPWLHALGVTDDQGKPAPSMADKLRQIEKFAEILGHLLEEAPLPQEGILQVFDMGCGKGYLTFAVSDILAERARVWGIEARADLVDFCTGVSKAAGMDGRLTFKRGSIADSDVGDANVLIALHACDTATDDALAKGIAAGAELILVAPCCQKEVRPQIKAPAVLSQALRHGIFLERQAEFVTDSLRAQLLSWAGYRTRVFEFISTEHTAKNTMISAVKAGKPGSGEIAQAIRDFAGFYGVTRQTLASHLGFSLT
jgi:hypothetical protein